VPWRKNPGGGYAKKGKPKGKGGNVGSRSAYKQARNQGKSKQDAARISHKAKKGKKK
jgi:hypothetical protein